MVCLEHAGIHRLGCQPEDTLPNQQHPPRPVPLAPGLLEQGPAYSTLLMTFSPQPYEQSGVVIES